VEIKYVNTKQMLADGLTKMLDEASFKDFRSLVLNLPD
jgi:hypothetical protein